VTAGAVYLKSGSTAPEGLPAPAAVDLMVAGGMTPENYTLPVIEGDARICEIYSEADVRDAAVSDADVLTVSYGEYVPSSSAVDYRPLIERAEELCRFHFSVRNNTYDKSALNILRREWFCATNPNPCGAEGRRTGP